MWRAITGVALVALAGSIDQAASQQPGPLERRHDSIEVLTNSLRVTTQITIIRTGMSFDRFGILTVAPVVNPGNCARPQDGYWTDSTQPGYHTYYAAALLAFAERATVEVVVFGCVADRPALVGLDIVR